MQLVQNKKNISINKRQFCTFWLNQRLFGVNILDVKEITSETYFTPIFHAPEEVKGYVNIRGKIHLVIDLRKILGFVSATVSMESKVVLFKQKIGESFGMLVDKVDDVIEVSEDEIEDRLNGEQGKIEIINKTQFIEGVCKLKKQLLLILNAKNILYSIISKELTKTTKL